MKDVQCYELFGGIALKNHAFSIYINDLQRESDFLFQKVSLAILRGTPSAFCSHTVIR